MAARVRTPLRAALVLSGALCLMIVAEPCSRAQSQDPGTAGQASPSQGATPSAQDSKSSTDTSTQGSGSAANPTLASTPNVTALGTASTLGLPSGALRWGSFYVSDASFIQSYDHANYVGPGAPSNFTGASATTITSLFQTDLVFNRLTHYGQFAVQYQPRLAITNGTVYPDYSNQNVGFDLVLTQNARWSVNFHDRFSYFSSQNLYGSSFGDVSSQTGTTVQNNFIDGPGSLLSDIAGMNIAYKLTPRTTLSFSPSYTYFRTTGSLLGKTSSDLYSGNASLNYQLSPRQTVGVVISGQYLHLLGVAGSTQIYSVGLSYSRQMGANWFITTSFSGTDTPGASTVQPWTYTGTASVARNFQKFSTGLVYSRELAQGYVTSEFADREDAFLAWRITDSIRCRLAVDAQREARASKPISAYYGNGEFDFRIAVRVTGFVNYGYRLQNGDASQVLTGHRSFVSGGLTWTANPAEPY